MHNWSVCRTLYNSHGPPDAGSDPNGRPRAGPHDPGEAREVVPFPVETPEYLPNGWLPEPLVAALLQPAGEVEPTGPLEPGSPSARCFLSLASVNGSSAWNSRC